MTSELPRCACRSFATAAMNFCALAFEKDAPAPSDVEGVEDPEESACAAASISDARSARR
jgi:hypothetical protein